MSLTEISVNGYRSIRDIRLNVRGVNLILGPNGCGKTNLYRSLYLLWAAATGRLARTVAEEGGMQSMTWAGPRSKGPVRITLGVTLAPFTYELSIGLSQEELGSPFYLDPHVKAESLAVGQVKVLERGKSGGYIRNREGSKDDFLLEFDHSESVLTQIANPYEYPHLSEFRSAVKGWRFYHQFRTDATSPLRSPQIGVRTRVMSHDGSDVAAALATIRQTKNGLLESAVRQAFHGAQLCISANEGIFEIQMSYPGIQRPLAAKELSDGTLRYLCLMAALYSPAAPTLLALNEPETSLHPEMIEPLAEAIAQAAGRTQIWITTHSTELAAHVERLTGARPVVLEMRNGETCVAGRSDTNYYRADE
jgi:predicted ATPase